jgi:hypothetical protein
MVGEVNKRPVNKPPHSYQWTLGLVIKKTGEFNAYYRR